jgi:glucans biosynthesis protein
MRTYDRRDILRSTAAAATVVAAPWSAYAHSDEEPTLQFDPPKPFSFASLIEQARDLARQAYAPPPSPAPDIVQRIDYDAHGAIHYRRNLALFADGGGVYPLTLFHLGRYFQHPVQIHSVEDGQARRLRYNPDYFEIPSGNIAKRMPSDSGFAGFRIHESRWRNDWKTQDWVAFLGASYFRAIGALGQYGLSARGVAVNTATETPEEFPRFTDFYVVPAADEQDPVVLYALLDGPSLTGAYRFEITRTSGVVMDVEKHLFIRSDIDRLGIAPLTSMFWYAEYNRPYRIDWRPEVHDSDGLALWTGAGERLWRPLNNPGRARASAFVDRHPRGFGLLQRDRDSGHYLDGVHYERRPSAWVEPLDDWGDGAVELVEIPTDDEAHDNIVALWRPDSPAKAGASFSFKYRLHWLAHPPYPPEPTAHCVATRIGRGGEPGTKRPEGVQKFVVEFAGPALNMLGPYDEPLAVVSVSHGRLSGIGAERVPGADRWRAHFDLAANGGEPVELRLYLRIGDRILTETWAYQHLPALAA